jgi:hypothetical protein
MITSKKRFPFAAAAGIVNERKRFFDVSFFNHMCNVFPNLSTLIFHVYTIGDFLDQKSLFKDRVE